MPVLLINQSEVPALLPMRECVPLMAETLATLTRGDAILPLRQVFQLPQGRGAFASMPAYLGTPAAIGIKVITVYPGNHGTAYDSHQGAVMLFEPEHGSLVAIIDASSITAIRTAAVSGVATQLLARSDAGDLAILGSGVQAETHLEAMIEVRPIRRVRVWSRDAAHVRAFAERTARRFGVPVEPAASAKQAVEGADIVCTATAAREPVLFGEWLSPGTHVNAVGASLRTARELDSSAVARARLFVDRRESALNEAGDFLIARSEGAVGDGHILGEVGELVAGTIRGRETPDDITLFKSLGLAVEDVASARHIYLRAQASGAGTRIELGGRSS